MTVTKEQTKNYSGLWMLVSIALGVWFAIYATNEPKRLVKAIQQRQLDTIAANDSLYILKYKLDTVVYNEQSDNN